MATKLAPAGLKCTFCGKHQDEVQHLLAGAGGVYICGECVAVCNEIIVRHPKPEETR